MAERIRTLLFEDDPAAAMIAKVQFPKHGIEIVEHAATLDEGLELAQRAGELNVRAAVVDQKMGGSDQDGANIIVVLRSLQLPPERKITIVEFSSGANEVYGGISTPRYGGDFAVLKDRPLKRIEQVADLIKAGHQ